MNGRKPEHYCRGKNLLQVIESLPPLDEWTEAGTLLPRGDCAVLDKESHYLCWMNGWKPVHFCQGVILLHLIGRYTASAGWLMTDPLPVSWAVAESLLLRFIPLYELRKHGRIFSHRDPGPQVQYHDGIFQHDGP